MTDGRRQHLILKGWSLYL